VEGNHHFLLQQVTNVTRGGIYNYRWALNGSVVYELYSVKCTGHTTPKNGTITNGRRVALWSSRFEPCREGRLSLFVLCLPFPSTKPLKQATTASFHILSNSSFTQFYHFKLQTVYTHGWKPPSNEQDSRHEFETRSITAPLTLD